MLVATRAIDTNRRPWKLTFFASLLIAVLAMLSLAPYLAQSTETVKLRNALLLRDVDDADFNWTPDNVPRDFKQEHGPIDPFFAQVAERLRLADLPDDWARTVSISRHLLRSQVKPGGGAVRSDLRRTYQQITGNGEGYCGDFVRVFTAIATAAGMHVRNWAFSFDGFGGHGHIWPEVWNQQTHSWQLAGIFNNHYFVEIPGVPLSALEFRRALLENSASLRLVPIDPSSRPGWRYEEKAWEYYRQGLPQWYLWWGNDVFEYDRASLVSLFAGVSRPLEQFAAIVQGVSPGLQVLRTADNEAQVTALVSLRRHVLVVIALLLISSVVMVVSVLRWHASWQWPRRSV